MNIHVFRWAMMMGLASGFAIAMSARGQPLPPRDPPVQPVTQTECAETSSAASAAKEIEQLRRELNALKKNLDEMNLRMGRETHTPTVFNTFERRIEEMQRQLDRLERDLNARLRKLEEQVDRLERQSRGR